jgi:predicted DNA repair protein MutK
MPSGLVALLDDIAGITKLAAASLDDVGAAAGKAGSKAMGVVIDDTAVTPRYVVGLSPERELPIIGKIALGSLRNKLLILLPVALLLSSLAPWAITPLLMLGGAFLCFEGAEKIIEAFEGGDAAQEDDAVLDPAQLEQSKVSGAIRTDLILSAEIMAIALADVAGSPFLTRAVVLALVGIGITVGVYGVVALIVKMDDIGLHLARRRTSPVRTLGRGMVRAMPAIMAFLSTVGTVAMVWVGGGILVHGMEVLGFATPAHIIHDLAEGAANAVGGAGAFVSWLVTATGSGLVGLAIGAVIAFVVHKVKHRHAAH